MLREQHQLLKEFVFKPWKKFTFKEIKTLSKKKSESYVYDSLKNFVKEGILNEEKAGNVILYSLNLSSLKTQMYAGFIAGYIAWDSKHLPFKDIAKITSKLGKIEPFIITGSYAKNKQTQGSDIDIVIIIDDSQSPQTHYARLNQICELNIPPIHLYVFTRSEFLKMLTNKELNYGKEIARNNLILAGGEEYFNIMNEAIQNGFKG